MRIGLEKAYDVRGRLCTTSSVHTYRKGHLCNTAEEHLQQGEEEEAGVELTLSNAVGVQVGPQKQGGSNECHYASLQSMHMFLNHDILVAMSATTPACKTYQQICCFLMIVAACWYACHCGTICSIDTAC